jgi:hypothetical protein
MTPLDRQLFTACLRSSDAGLGDACRAIAAGADVNCTAGPPVPQPVTPLMAAAEIGSVRVCELLLRKGAAVNAQLRGSGSTALHVAAARGHGTVAELLMVHGAHIDVANSTTGRTPLSVACSLGHVVGAGMGPTGVMETA